VNRPTTIPASSLTVVAMERPESVIRQQRKRSLQRDPNSLTASVSMMTGPNKKSGKLTVAEWQNAAWTYYDSIGELRFGVNWLAKAMSRVNLIAAFPPSNQGEEPQPISLEDDSSTLARRAVELVEQIAGGVAGQGQLLGQTSKQLTVPGLGYIYATADDETDSFSTWAVLSNDEVKKQQEEIQVTDPETGDWVAIEENDLLIKVWNAHPRRRHEPDSPVRAVLPSLAEIELITKRIAADCRSRLAGNGLLVMPAEAEFPPGQGNVDAEDGVDEFTETFIQVTTIPIMDQSAPAATTPLIVKVPGEYAAAVQHLTFYSAFDAALDPLRQAAIRRLALGLDMPPEVLLGMAESNHWTAWQVAEEAITLHIEPLAETICHALTVGFMQAALEAEGHDKRAAIVWYDTTDLRTRPNLTEAASEAHARIKISDEAYLTELGLDPSMKPTDEEFKRRVLLDVAKGAPTLAPAMLAAAGILPDEVAQAAESVPADPEAGAPAPEADDQAGDAVDGPPEAQAASAAILAAADGLVVRALERAGMRLRNAAGKKVAGGADAVPCDDPALLHTRMSATTHASLDNLLAGAWDRLPAVAVRHHIDPASLQSCLDGYCRGLLAAGHAHDYDRLANALGVDDHRPVAVH
jgi:serine protease inhibitor ecotin